MKSKNWVNRQKSDQFVKKAKQLGIEIVGNYTFGYPDETFVEILKTLFLARKHMAAGLDAANFMFITPFPGTQLYDYAIEKNILRDDINLESMDWTRPSMKTKVPGWFFRLIITKGWRWVNNPERINRIKGFTSTKKPN